MPIFSLPARYGIGTLGRAAFSFIDFLKAAGQRWWQILPVGPTGYGDSPYQSFSTYAGNPYFIDLDLLIEEGLLTQEEVDAIDWGSDPCHVDYEKIYTGRTALLQKAAKRGYPLQREEVAQFAAENPWVADYALYMALKQHFDMAPWTLWPDREIRLHKPQAVTHYTNLLKEDIIFFTFVQYLFFKQWNALRAYADKQGIGIIGDLPIYVSMDSADVWSAPEQFLLDEDHRPTLVAGVPPDYFCEDGQLWGNPLYDWDAMAADGYGWWIRRIGAAAKLYDIIRIDHFRAFEAYWAVPYGAKTAKNGRWIQGPGLSFVSTITGWFHNVQFIAEDLGFLTQEVHDLVAQAGLPGMKVLQFAFDPQTPSRYLPHTFERNCVCYVGTHDNTTAAAWREEADPKEVAFAGAYLGLNDNEGFVWGLLRAGMSSVADLFIAQLQDFLELGKEGRINTPGTATGNWCWRMEEGVLTPALCEKIATLTTRYGR